MHDDINALTARLVSGQITCGAYADAVYAIQHSGRVSAVQSASEASETDDDDDSDDSDENASICGDCADMMSEDDTFGCNKCGEIICVDCMVYDDGLSVGFCAECHDESHADSAD